MGYAIQQSQTAQHLLFLLVSSTDHVTPVTGITPVVKISKNGATGVSPSGAITEVDATNLPGWYKLAGNATDSNTLGPLLLHATGTGADPTDDRFDVVAFNPQSATNLGLSALPTASPAAAGGLPTVDASNAVKVQSGTGANQISLSSGLVTVGTNNDKTGYTASTVSDKTGYSLTQAFPANFASLAISVTTGMVTTGTVATDAITSASFAAGTTIPRVTLCDTTTSNTDMRGTDNAALAATALTNATWTDAKAVFLDAAITSRMATFTYTAPPAVDANGAVKARPVDAAGDYFVATSSLQLGSTGLDAVVVETGINARQAIALIMDAAPAGIITGAGTTTVTVKDPGGVSNRVVATVTSDGDRSAVTLTPPA